MSSLRIGQNPSRRLPADQPRRPPRSRPGPHYAGDLFKCVLSGGGLIESGEPPARTSRVISASTAPGSGTLTNYGPDVGNIERGGRQPGVPGVCLDDLDVRQPLLWPPAPAPWRRGPGRPPVLRRGPGGRRARRATRGFHQGRIRRRSRSVPQRRRLDPVTRRPGIGVRWFVSATAQLRRCLSPAHTSPT